MGTSNLIAATALIVSMLSAWVSYLAYRYSTHVKQEESDLALSREKSEFLVRVEKAIKTYDRLEKRLNNQLSRIDSASETVCSGLTNEIEQLMRDLKHLEGCQRQAWSLWNEACEMDQPGLAHHKPNFLGLIEDDEQFTRDAMHRCDRIDEALTKASI